MLSIHWLSGSFVKESVGTAQQSCDSPSMLTDYLYAGVQFGSHCFCGNSYGKYGQLPESRCNVTCPGDHSQICGGPGANSVYGLRRNSVYRKSKLVCSVINDMDLSCEHHENTPIQIYWKFYHQKNWKFSDKTGIFHISAQNTDCGYSLEPPRRGVSNVYPQSLFLSRIKENNVYPSKPQFYYIKVGFKGGKII